MEQSDQPGPASHPEGEPRPLTFASLPCAPRKSLKGIAFFLAPFSLATLLATTSPDDACACNRPGTPKDVVAIPTSPTSAKFIFTHTTGKGSTCCHASYIDVSVSLGGSGGPLHDKDIGNRHYTSVSFGMRSEIEFTGLPEGHTVCFKAWARTSPNGCRSQIPSADACVNLPPRWVHDICAPYQAKALEQAERIRFMRQEGECSGNPNEGRWTGLPDQHYTWCVAEAWAGNRAFPDFEQRERERILTKVCKPLPASKPAPGQRVDGNGPAGPDGKPTRCVSVELHNDECNNDAGERDWVIDPGTLHSGCFNGPSEEAALTTATWALWTGHGLFFTDNDIDAPPTADEPDTRRRCSYTKDVYAGCNCIPGLQTRSYSTTPAKPKVISRPEDTLSSRSPSVGAALSTLAGGCKGGMVTDGSGKCVCPARMVWHGDRCRRLLTPTKTSVMPGDSRAAAAARAALGAPDPATCPKTRPIGRPPYCCPVGTRYERRACRTSGGAKAKPIVPPQLIAPTLPARCPITRPIGKPPRCCPIGTRYGNGVCLRRSGAPSLTERPSGQPAPTRATCPASRPVGNPPYCCPAGTHYERRACRIAKASRPNPASGATTGTTSGCPVSRPVGRPPHCCPSGTSYRDGACRK